MPTLRARRPRRLTPLALAPAAALLVALAGCADSPEIPDADPAPSASPLFASEEEALEAAVAVYEEYNAVAYQVRQERVVKHNVLNLCFPQSSTKRRSLPSGRSSPAG